MPGKPRRRFPYARRPLAERLQSFKERRPRGPLVPGRSLNPRQQKELQRANHLMAVGDHIAAARIFEDMASRAHDRSIIYPVPMLYLQAAHAYLLGEQLDLSIQHARRGLEQLAGQQRWPLLQNESQRYLAEISVQHSQRASELASWLAGLTPQPLPAAATPNPDTCPYCGAHGSLEPLAAGRATRCRYCASVVHPHAG